MGGTEPVFNISYVTDDNISLNKKIGNFGKINLTMHGNFLDKFSGAQMGIIVESAVKVYDVTRKDIDE